MKNLSFRKMYVMALFLITAATLTNCVHVHHPRHRTIVVKQKSLPPGQAKKIYGDKSARRHAPGHNK